VQTGLKPILFRGALAFDEGDAALLRWHQSTSTGLAVTEETWGCVVYDPVNSLYRFFLQDHTLSNIWQKTSTLGRVFTNKVLALDKNAGQWDAYYVGTPFVWYEAGQTRPWRMLYSGKATSGGLISIGLATSVDGAPVWERKDTAGNALTAPVLSASTTPGDWDYNATIDIGSAIKVGSTYYVWYSPAGGTLQIGLATSTDLVTWPKDANNPIYRATTGPDIVGAELNSTRGRWCADIVRWDRPDGTTRYVMYVPHAVGSTRTPTLECYTCPTPTFHLADRSYVGTVYQTSITSPSYHILGGTNVTDLDEPRILTDDITRNVLTTQQGGNNQKRMALSLYTYGASWQEAYLTYEGNRGELSGYVEPDGTTQGCKYSGICCDLPASDPRIRLAPAGTDSHVKALWLPGMTGTLLDLSGGGFDIPSVVASGCDSKGVLFTAANNDIAKYVAYNGPPDPSSVLAAIRTDFTIEFRATFASAWTSLYRMILVHQTHAGGTFHFEVGVQGGATNYTLYFAWHSTSNRSATATFPVAGIDSGTQYRFAVCHDQATSKKIYFFKDGTLLNAGGTAFDYTCDDYTADNPTQSLSIGSTSAVSQHWDGYLDEVRISDSCRWTANYTPAAITYGYATNGYIYLPVYDLGAAGHRAYLDVIQDALPSGCAVTVMERTAANATDLDTTWADFSAQPGSLTDRYQQFALHLAGDGTNTPSLKSVSVRTTR
jgi:hypothetical protein